jgi:predicted AlkP superfamily phosphohydrolase/phosphomutase
MVYLDNLSWRAAGTLGHGTDYLLENDTGPDDAVHSKAGIAILGNCGLSGRLEGAQIQDIGPTILRLAGIEPSAGMIGKSLV